MHYLWWVPAVLIYYVAYAWMSKQNNVHGGKWLWIMLVFGAACPWWLIISRVSKRLLFDGMLYDNLMFLAFVVTMLVLSRHESSMPIYKYVGLGFVVAGSVMMRI